MDDVFKNSTLASALDSESDEEEVPKGVIRAPNVNSGAAKRTTCFRRVYVDSRDRDRARYPSANDFRQSMSVPVRGVRSVTLTDAFMPIVAGYPYVAVVLRNLKDRSLILPRESPGLPGGVLAMVPMIPPVALAGYTYYRAQPGQRHGGSGIGWKVVIPQGLAQLDDLHFQLLTWDWVAGAAAMVPFPIPADAVPPLPPVFASNVTLSIEIEYDIN